MLDSILQADRLVVFTAHPDDESLAFGGTIARAVDAGAAVTIVCATRGELGPVSDVRYLRGKDLGTVREAELTSAANVLGADVEMLGHGDGMLRAQLSDLTTSVTSALARLEPDVVLTFDEDGLYWHPDHIAVHDAVVAALATRQERRPRLLAAHMTAESISGATAAARRCGAPADSSFWGLAPEAFGHRIAHSDLHVDVRPVAARKLKALRAHRTQLNATHPLLRIGSTDFAAAMGVEHFRVAGG
jgi:N-acetyl-1-D-myo-inositol-2-amino-2-deoxy-alpha-D-glucopyranoside deacetylase